MFTVRDAEKLLASKTHITFEELAEISGQSVGSLRIRAHRGTAVVEYCQPGGPNGTRLITSDSVRAAVAAGTISLIENPNT